MNDFHTRNENGTEDAMDWYPGGASKSSGSSGNPGMEPKPAAGMPLVSKCSATGALAATGV
jgi:hypothetical protein